MKWMFGCQEQEKEACKASCMEKYGDGPKNKKARNGCKGVCNKARKGFRAVSNSTAFAGGDTSGVWDQILARAAGVAVIEIVKAMTGLQIEVGYTTGIGITYGWTDDDFNLVVHFNDGEYYSIATPDMTVPTPAGPVAIKVSGSYAVGRSRELRFGGQDDFFTNLMNCASGNGGMGCDDVSNQQ